MANDPFHDDNVKRFAAAWYQALDVHAPTDDLARLLVDDGLEMIFPEKTLIGLGDFKAWYAGGTYSDGEKAPGVINIFFDEVHVVKSVAIERRGDEAVVDVVVGWQASWFSPPAAKSTRTAMDATQRWTLRRCAEGKNPFGIEVTSYNAMAKPFVYAPGFATL
jgi:hypothetical protein